MTSTQIASFEASAKQLVNKYYQAFSETVQLKNAENVQAYINNNKSKFNHEIAHLVVDTVIECNGDELDLSLLRNLAQNISNNFSRYY